MDNKQLYEKQSNQYNPFFPIVRLEDIIETISDKSIQWILNNYNHIYVEYSESVAITRNKVPSILRRNGLWISYNTGKDIITEWYKGKNTDINAYDQWTNDINWAKFEPLADGKVTYQHLSHALKQLIGKGNVITNFPDEEDITTDGTVLKFKNREYNADGFSGMGRIILRKNIKKTGDGYKNILSQDMFIQSNTIYEIRYDFDLNGEEITIPEGCVLDFQGGSLNNGIIIGNNTNIISNNKCLSKIVLKNIFKIDLTWFTNIRNKNIDISSCLKELIDSIDETIFGVTVIIPEGEFYIGNSHFEFTNVNVNCYGKFYTKHTEQLSSSFKFRNTYWEKRLNIKGLKVYAIDGWDSERKGIGIDVYHHNISMTDCEVFYHNYGLISRGWAHTYINCTYLSNNINISTSIASKEDSPYGSNAGAASIFIGGQCTQGRKYNVILGDSDINEKEYGAIPTSAAMVFKGIAFDQGIFLCQGVKVLSIEDCYFESVTENSAIVIGENNGIVKITGNYFNGLKYGIKINNPLVVLDVHTNYFINILGVAILLHTGVEQPYIFDNYYHSSGLLKQKVYTPVPHNRNLGEASDFILDRYKNIEVKSWDYNSNVKCMQGDDIKYFEKFYMSYYPCYTYLTDKYNLSSGVFNIKNCICTPNNGDISKFNGGDFIVINGILGFISEIDFDNKTIKISSNFSSLSGEFTISQQEVSKAEIIDNKYNLDGSSKSQVIQVREIKQISGSGKTFQIIEDINLNGSALTLGGGCTIDFSKGGKLSNGTINLNGAKIIPSGLIVDDYITATIYGFAKGQCLFDNELNKPKWYNGSKWVDATGAEV